MLVGNTHTFAQFIQAWQYVCAQFSAAKWNVLLALHHRDPEFSNAPFDRILPVVQPLALHVKHYDKLAG